MTCIFCRQNRTGTQCKDLCDISLVQCCEKTLLSHFRTPLWKCTAGNSLIIFSADFLAYQKKLQQIRSNGQSFLIAQFDTCKHRRCSIFLAAARQVLVLRNCLSFSSIWPFPISDFPRHAGSVWIYDFSFLKKHSLGVAKIGKLPWSKIHYKLTKHYRYILQRTPLAMGLANIVMSHSVTPLCSGPQCWIFF